MFNNTHGVADLASHVASLIKQKCIICNWRKFPTWYNIKIKVDNFGIWFKTGLLLQATAARRLLYYSAAEINHYTQNT